LVNSVLAPVLTVRAGEPLYYDCVAVNLNRYNTSSIGYYMLENVICCGPDELMARMTNQQDKAFVSMRIQRDTTVQNVQKMLCDYPTGAKRETTMRYGFTVFAKPSKQRARLSDQVLDEYLQTRRVEEKELDIEH
jgi:hypothetical protein